MLDAGIAISTAAGAQHAPRRRLGATPTTSSPDWTPATAAGDTDIYGARVRYTGTVRDPAGIAISISAPNVQVRLSVAFPRYLVAWEDSRSGINDIYGARVRVAGIVLDPAGIAISTAANNQRPLSCRLLRHELPRRLG